MQTNNIIQIKNRTKLLFISFFACFISAASLAQSPEPLRVKYNIMVDGGNRKTSKVVVEKDGERWRSRAGDDPKNYFDLEYQHDYLFIFSKPGYVTKKIFFSTKVPQDKLKSGFDPYAFDLTIFKQMDGVNLVVFNQPVARVIFNPELDDFGYDTDYTKSVLSGIQEAETELKEKIKEEKSKPKKDRKPEVSNQAEESTTQNGNENGGSQEESTKKTSAEDDKKKSGSTDDSRDKNKAVSSDDGRGAKGLNKEPVNREERQYVEGNKRITEITLVRNDITYVYKKVVYVWGVFYFRNNTSIPESIYVQEAL